MSAARDIVFAAAGAAAGTSGDASWTSAAFMARARRCDEAGGARGVDLNTTNRSKRTKVGNGPAAVRARAPGKFFSGHSTLT